jgi:hypothetical protein
MSTRSQGWDGVVEEMLRELRGLSARADAYWAQQLAFGPVLFHALALKMRANAIAAEDFSHLSRAVELAFAALGMLPDAPGGDPASLRIHARRQAVALASGRRRLLRKLAARLHQPLPAVPGVVPTRLLRSYPLLGWRAPRGPDSAASGLAHEHQPTITHGQ